MKVSKTILILLSITISDSLKSISDSEAFALSSGIAVTSLISTAYYFQKIYYQIPNCLYEAKRTKLEADNEITESQTYLESVDNVQRKLNLRSYDEISNKSFANNLEQGHIDNINKVGFKDYLKRISNISKKHTNYINLLEDFLLELKKYNLEKRSIYSQIEVLIPRLQENKKKIDFTYNVTESNESYFSLKKLLLKLSSINDGIVEFNSPILILKKYYNEEQMTSILQNDFSNPIVLREDINNTLLQSNPKISQINLAKIDLLIENLSSLQKKCGKETENLNLINPIDKIPNNLITLKFLHLYISSNLSYFNILEKFNELEQKNRDIVSILNSYNQMNCTNELKRYAEITYHSNIYPYLKLAENLDENINELKPIISKSNNYKELLKTSTKLHNSLVLARNMLVSDNDYILERTHKEHAQEIAREKKVRESQIQQQLDLERKKYEDQQKEIKRKIDLEKEMRDNEQKILQRKLDLEKEAYENEQKNIKRKLDLEKEAIDLKAKEIKTRNKEAISKVKEANSRIVEAKSRLKEAETQKKKNEVQEIQNEIDLKKIEIDEQKLNQPKEVPIIVHLQTSI